MGYPSLNFCFEIRLSRGGLLEFTAKSSSLKMKLFIPMWGKNLIWDSFSVWIEPSHINSHVFLGRIIVWDDVWNAWALLRSWEGVVRKQCCPQQGCWILVGLLCNPSFSEVRHIVSSSLTNKLSEQSVCLSLLHLFPALIWFFSYTCHVIQ